MATFPRPLFNFQQVSVRCETLTFDIHNTYYNKGFNLLINGSRERGSDGGSSGAVWLREFFTSTDGLNALALP